MGQDIREIIDDGEGVCVEFHGARTRLKTLGKSVCGMLNQQGGVILFGVDDRGKAGSVEAVESRAEQLLQFLDSQLEPKAVYAVTIQSVDGETIVVIDVPQGVALPYALDGEVFVRLETQTVRTQVLRPDAGENSASWQTSAFRS